jgi:hypothetical protein
MAAGGWLVCANSKSSSFFQKLHQTVLKGPFTFHCEMPNQHANKPQSACSDKRAMKRKQGDGVCLADRVNSAADSEQSGCDGGQVEAGGVLAITMCSMDGTFQVTVKRDALVDDLADAIAEARGIANARRAVAVFVAGFEEPLAGGQSVVGSMANTGATELFMLVRECNDREVLEEIYNANDGASWDEGDSWMSEAPISEWQGVTADADGNVAELELSHNCKISVLPESVGRLLRLQKLDLRYCSELGKLPETLGELACLRHLELEGCIALEVTDSVGESIGRLANLQILNLACTTITSLPKSLGGLITLKELVLFDCCSLQSLPESLGRLVNLQNLIVDGCCKLEDTARINATMRTDVPGCTMSC